MSESTGLPASVEEAESELQQVSDWVNQAMQQLPIARERASFLNGFILAHKQLAEPAEAEPSQSPE